MKRKRCGDERIALARGRAESGTPVEEICRKIGISGSTWLTGEEAVGGDERPTDPAPEAD